MPMDFQAAAASIRAGLNIKVKRSGRLQPPKLDQGPLTVIGKNLVVQQRLRWQKGIDAFGNKAPVLTKKYLFIKQAYTGVHRPIRDNKMTGALQKNFQLRKALQGTIRAEPTQRLTRAHSMRAEQFAHMTGFAPSDEVSLYRDVIKAYEQYARTAWVPKNG